MNVLDQVVLLVLNVSIWHGRKKLRKEDLAANGIDVTHLPPSTLATLGSKRTISPKAISWATAVKREAERLSLSVGTRFATGGLYMVPQTKINDLCKELKRMKDEFDQQVDDLTMKYDAETQGWIDENPEWASIIQSAIEPVSNIRRQMKFQFSVIKMSEEESVENNGLAEELTGLYPQLCHEIRVAAKQSYEDSFVGRLEVNRKALRPINSIKQKLMGLSFLDPSINDIIQVIDDSLSRVPKTGAIKGADLNMLAGLLGRQLANMGRVVPAEPEIDLEAEPEEEETTLTMEPYYVPVDEEVSAISWDF